MVSITTEYHFCAAHRIEGHPKCGRLHGHNYKVEVTVTRPPSSMMNAPDKTLDEMGFVIDFGELKPIVKQVVDFFDHTYMVSVANIDAKCPYYKAAGAGSRDVSLVPVMQSSAELLAAFFKEAIQENLVSHGHADVAVTEVAVWETAKNCARA